MDPEDRQPVFFFDLTEPWCYLAAEQIMGALPIVPEWEPVHASALDLDAAEPAERGLVARRVAELGLQPLRWPVGWPADGGLAALAASYAKRGGRAVAFSLAAFRQEFAGGRDLDDEATVLIAAAACEMHPAAVLKGVTLRSTAAALEQAGDRARALGVTRLPAIVSGDALWSGPEAVGQAAAALADPVR